MRGAKARTAAFILVAVAGVALAGCGTVHAGQAGTSAASSSGIDGPAQAGPCTASDLSVSNGPEGAAGTQLEKLIDIVNVSSAACLLQAEPALRIEVAGKPETLKYAQASTQATVEFAAHGSGILAILINDNCTYSTSKKSSITAASVGLSGGTVGVAGWTATSLVPCAAPSALPIAVAPSSLAGAQASAQPGVEAKLAPVTAGAAKPGSLLPLSISLQNTRAADFGTATCPVYTITLFGPMAPGATKTTEQAALPCAARSNGAARTFELTGHASVGYRLTFKIPATAVAGEYKLYWLSSSFPGTQGGVIIKIS